MFSDLGSCSGGSLTSALPLPPTSTLPVYSLCSVQPARGAVGVWTADPAPALHESSGQQLPRQSLKAPGASGSQTTRRTEPRAGQ